MRIKGCENVRDQFNEPCNVGTNQVDELRASSPEIFFETFSNRNSQITSLEQEAACHRSKGFKTFCSKCTDKVLWKPLEATFHICCNESEKSRKRCRSLHVSRGDSYSSNSPGSTPPAEIVNDPVDPLNENIVFEGVQRTDDVCKRMRYESTESLDSVNSNCFKSFFDNTQSPSGRGLDEEEEDIDETQSNIPLVGMTSKTNADLLIEQRRLSTDVSQKLENRWLQSHFAEQLNKKEDGLSKRHKRKCLNNGILEGRQTLHPLNETNKNDDVRNMLSILHFNDVYEIEEQQKEPVAGAARFSELFKKKIAESEEKFGERPLVVFSGDCLNPSTLSCATMGWHMVEILNELGVDVAAFGNHEFDFGVEHAIQCVQKMSSKWLLANVIDKQTNRNLAEGKSSMMITRKNGLKIGLIGLVEEEWLDTLTTVGRSMLEFKDFVKVAQQLAAELKEHGANLVIAVTHMRWPNDIKLAEEVSNVDLILGGHDHGYKVQNVDECLIVKSGSDFRTFSSIDFLGRPDGCVDVRLSRYDVTSESTSPDPLMKSIVDRYMSNLEASLQKCIGTIQGDLNGKFEHIRSQETTLGNFVADIMATATEADLVLINSGTFRSDNIHKRGEFLLRDLMTILPINDKLVSIVVTGKQLLQALENGVSKYPKLEGRFPQLSGACFGFNPSADPGKRVVKETVRIRGKPLDLNHKYVMVTKDYVALGRDGYTCLSDCKVLTDPHSGPLLSTVVQNHFLNIKRLLDFEKRKSCKIRISSNGKHLTSDKSELDISEAFEIEEHVDEPLNELQKNMQSVMNDNAKNIAKANEITFSSRKMHHLPNFISVSCDIMDSSPSELNDVNEQKLFQLRKAAWSADPNNVKILEERARSPDDIKWQTSSVIEARIFHCESIDG